MIGNVVRQQVAQSRPVVSTRLRDAILESWTEQRDGQIPTLIEQDNIWQEFWLYASGTKGWCPRLCAIQALSPALTGERFNAETMWNFDQGHAYHDLFQQKILPSLGNRFLGSWERVCHSDSDPDTMVYESAYKGDRGGMEITDNHLVEWGMGPKPDGHGWKYKETKIRIVEERIVVKLDGILHWGDDVEVFELKTEKSGARDSLDPMMGGKPRDQHVDQVMIAMYATGIRKARIVYMFKGESSFQSSLLEHEIVYDEKRTFDLLRVAKRCVDAVRLVDDMNSDNPNGDPLFADDTEKAAWMDSNFQRLPGCPMKSKGNARYCSARDECFPGRGKKRN